MKNTIFLITMFLFLFSCKKEVNVSEWDVSNRTEIINPLSSVKMFQTVSLIDNSRYLIEGINEGVKTFTVAKVDGNNLTVSKMDGSLLFSKIKDSDRSMNMARLTLSCQETQRNLCYNSTTCSVAYTISWWTMELIFAANCSLGTRKL